MPGNFGIPNEGAQLDALGEVIDANSEMLEGIIVAAMYPLTTLLTDNECLLDSVASGANRLLSKIENPIGKELSRIADALVAQLAYETGATGEELNRALALAEDVALPDADEPAQQPLADAGPAIQDILEGDVAAGGDFGPDAAAAPAAQVDRAEAPPRVGLEGLGRDLFERWAPVNDPDAVPLHKIPCAMGGQGVVVPEALDKGLPLPGSKLFYENIDAYLAGFSALGAQLAGFVGNELTKENLIRMVEELETKIPNELSPSAIQYKIFVKTMRFVVEHSESVLSTIRNSVKCAWELSRLLTPNCNIDVVVGVVVCKSILSVLREIQAGWDAAVWAVAKIRVDIPHVEGFLDHLLNYACPMEVPPPHEAIHAWTKGLLSDQKRDVILKWHGINPESYTEVIQSRSEMLGLREYIQYLRRDQTSNEKTIELLVKRGLTRPGEAEAAVELYDELPTISDHLAWLRKNVYNDEYVAKYRLMEGFEERFWKKFGADLTALGMKKENAALHYAAHWNMPAPEQMKEMVYRLRPGKPGVTEAFTLDDLGRILAEQDFNPLAVEWFKQTALHVPALSYLRDMYRQGLLNDAEMKSYHQDLGYSEHDSELFLRIDRIQKDRMRAGWAHGWNPAAIASAYATGQKDSLFVQFKMQQLGFAADEAVDMMERAEADVKGRVVTRARTQLLSNVTRQVESALDVGVMNVQQAAQILTQVGWPAEQAIGVAQLQAANAQTKRVKHVITQLRGAYHRGEVSTLFVQEQMQALGITPQALQGYLSTWQLERTPNRKRRTAAQIATDVAEGAMTTAEALVRLTNLGYEQPDRMLYLEDARRKVVEIQAGANIAGTLTGKRREEVVAQLARGAQGLSKRLVKDLQVSAPVDKLQKWAAAGIVSKAEFWSRMRLYGIEESTIHLWWEEACVKKGARCDGTEVLEEGAGSNGVGPSGNGEANGAGDTPVSE